MNYAVCRGKCETLNPFVLHQMIKKYSDIIGGYAFIKVANDRVAGEINITVEESDSGRFTKPVKMNNATWDSDYDEIEVVMLKTDDTMNFIEKHEMEDIMEKYRSDKEVGELA